MIGAPEEEQVRKIVHAAAWVPEFSTIPGQVAQASAE